MFFLFFFFPFPHPPPPLPSDVRGKNKQDKQIQISYFLLDCFLLKWSHTNWPQICVSMHKWTNNEWAGMKMKSYWKWTLCIIIIFYIFFSFAVAFDNLSPDVQNFQQGSWVFPQPRPPTSHFFFSLHIYLFFSQADGFAPTVVQFNIYMFPSVWFPPQREVGIPASDLPRRWSGPSF